MHKTFRVICHQLLLPQIINLTSFLQVMIDLMIRVICVVICQVRAFLIFFWRIQQWATFASILCCLQNRKFSRIVWNAVFVSIPFKFIIILIGARDAIVLITIFIANIFSAHFVGFHFLVKRAAAEGFIF